MNGYITYTITDGTFQMEEEVIPTDLQPSLKDMQAVVGGLIEAMFTIPSPFRESVSITGYVNEEGLLINLPMVGAVNDAHGHRPFAGNLLVTGLNDLTGEGLVLNQDELNWIISNRTYYGLQCILDIRQDTVPFSRLSEQEEHA